jgi:hypothetical protein
MEIGENFHFSETLQEDGSMTIVEKNNEEISNFRLVTRDHFTCCFWRVM